MSLFQKMLIGLTGLLGTQLAKSQQLDLKTYATEQKKLQQTGMKVLAGWAGANIISGAYFTSHTSGSAQYFHRMNAYWNVVNGALAGFSLWRLSKEHLGDDYFAEIYKKQHTLEKIFMVNAGLDAAYMLGGLYLNKRSKNDGSNSNRSKGYGNSIILQGGFLLLFDGVLYTLMHQKGKKLEKVLDKVQIGSTGSNVSLLIQI